ncbi:MAG: hypothetical protein QF510_03215 [Rhodospirillales bacterium]|nr:hypothetical protein [Rhodospirillales bacterium]
MADWDFSAWWSSAKLELSALVTMEFPQIKPNLKTEDLPGAIPSRHDFHRGRLWVRRPHRREERQGFVGEIGSEPLIFDLVEILKNVIALGWIKVVIFKKLLLE